MKYFGLFLAGLLSWGSASQIVFSADACLIEMESAVFDACQERLVESAGPVVDGLRASADSRYQVVKFDRAINGQMRQSIEASGAVILGYLPHHAYLLELPASDRASLATLDGAIWVGAYPPGWKIDQNLAAVLAMPASERPVALPIRVSLHRGVPAKILTEQIASLPGVVTHHVSRGEPRDAIILTSAEPDLSDLVQSLLLIDEVAHVGVQKMMQHFNSQGAWLHQSGQAGQFPIFDQGLFGCGQVVGVADSGVDFPHCSFTDPDLGTPPISDCADGPNCPPATADFNQRKVGLYYKFSPASDPLGDSACPGGASSGHGTHVAGSVLGNNFANAVDCETFTTPGGLSNLDGMAPGAKLIAQEMGDSLQYLNSLGGNVAHLVSTAHASGARLHNNSWGGSCTFLGLFCLPGCTVTYDALTESSDFAAWEHPDMAIFFAAGNDGTVCGAGNNVGSPGNAKNTITVGASQRGTASNAMAGFSSRGPVHDRRTKPDIVAQGQGVVSAGSDGNANTSGCAECTLSGTSMASPTATGMGALVREYLERGFYPSGQASPDDERDFISGALVRALLINSGRSMTGTGAGSGAPNQAQGWGRVQLDEMLYFGQGDRRLWLSDNADGLASGQDSDYLIEVLDADEPLRFTLVWHDHPASVGAGIALVNRLRLEVTDPAGDVWRQKIPASGTPNPFQGTGEDNLDDRNNVHQIRFDTPLTGQYQVRVVALSVPMGDNQPYALAVNGALSFDEEQADFAISANPNSASVCSGEPVDYTLELTASGGFSDSVSLTPTGDWPAAAALSIVPTELTPPGSALATVGTEDLEVGSYSLEITASSDGPGMPGLARSVEFGLELLPASLGGATAVAPAVGATGIDPNTALSWTAVDGATGYRLQVAANHEFDDPIVDVVVSGTSYQPDQALPGGTTWFWRVAPENDCASSEFGSLFAFATTEQFCSTPSLAIPDNDPDGIADELLVNLGRGGNAVLDSIRVSLDVTHSWAGDLRFELTHPNGDTVVVLADRPGLSDSAPFGCNGADYDVLLDDEAGTSVQDVCLPATPTIAGVLAPNEALSAFTGEAVEGTWTLTVSDNAADDTGTLNQWCLLPEYQGGSNPVPVLLAVDPSSAMVGQQDITLTLSGMHFLADSVVRWAGTDLATTWVSGNSLEAILPAALLESEGQFPVTVHSPEPGGGNSAEIGFTVIGNLLFQDRFEQQD